MAASVFFIGASPVGAVVISFPDFTSTAGLTLNGAAAQVGNRLRLTPDQPSMAGSVFLDLAFSTNQPFVVVFQFQISGSQTVPLRSDGLAFVIQSDSRGANALGNAGESLGYADHVNSLIQITPSVIVEFDTFQNPSDPNDNHVGVMKNGDEKNHSNFGPAGLPGQSLDDGQIKTVLITYRPFNNRLIVDLLAPQQRVFDGTVDIGSIVGSQAIFGFTAATGRGFANHDILRWTLRVPESGTLEVFTVGLVGLGFLTRRRRMAA